MLLHFPMYFISLIKILQMHAFLSCGKGLAPLLLLIWTLSALLFSTKPPFRLMLCPTTLLIYILGPKKIRTKNSSILGSFADFTRLAKSTPVVLSGFPFLIIGFWQRGGEKKDFYQTLFTGQWIFFTIWMYLWNAWVIHYSRFWSMTMGRRNDWWYLFPDFISLILFIPWPVYLD